jgi:phosphatidylglycerophosphate synthase
MIDGPFRTILPRFSEPILKIYIRLGLTPNHVTFAGFCTGLLAAYLVSIAYFKTAIAIWWISRLLDGTDGIYARATQQVSPLGGYLDILLDMAAYGAMILGFAIQFADLGLTWTIIEFLYILCITSALSLGSIERAMNMSSHDNRTLRLASGLAEGGETGIAYTVFLLFPAALNILSIVWIAILILTVVARSFLAARVLSSKNG